MMKKIGMVVISVFLGVSALTGIFITCQQSSKLVK